MVENRAMASRKNWQRDQELLEKPFEKKAPHSTRRFMEKPVLVLVSQSHVMLLLICWSFFNSYAECKVKHGNQDKLSLKKCAMGGSPRHVHNERKDIPLCNISHNHLGFSNLEITSSPYEIRLSNWISDQLTSEKQEVKHHEECNSLEFCFCYPNMNCAERDDQTDHFWDSLASLWDME